MRMAASIMAALVFLLFSVTTVFAGYTGKKSSVIGHKSTVKAGSFKGKPVIKGSGVSRGLKRR